jgi:acetyl/propionyl-CoA carboxylase alpha subunit/acetyl-CoA carboxylase carboxyltransferase component
MVTRLLVANRGEIAIRILRAAAELSTHTVAVFSEDDANALHIRKADEAYPLRGSGARAYLDLDQIVAAALERRCDAIHPGYGFLSEQPAIAQRCREAGIAFVGPDAETLVTFGDKTRARALAQREGVPVLVGTQEPVSAEQAREFLASLGEGGTMLIKAVAGGGGRGMRLVSAVDAVEEAYQRSSSEAQQAFGDGRVYVEQYMPRARHVEVQIVGDGSGAVSHLWERECSVQRRHQKLIEVAPAPSLAPGLRDRLLADAVRMARAVRYRSLGTFEFLVDVDGAADGGSYAFIEANARLQVEHTVTEEVLDLDLVQIQLRLASGSTLAELGLQQADVPAPHGYAVQARVNTETMEADGTVRPGGGVLLVFDLPAGRGVRVETCGYTGYRTNPGFDSLLAKLIGHSSSTRFADAVATTYRALCELKVEGVRTNVLFLQSLLRRPEFVAGRIDTRFVDDHLAELITGDGEPHPRLFFEQPSSRPSVAGGKIDAIDPLAVLAYGKSGGADAGSSVAAPSAGSFQAVEPAEKQGPEGTYAVRAPAQATIVSVDVPEGARVSGGQQLVVLNAMKMEHVIVAATGGIVRRIAVAQGDTVYEGAPLLYIEEQEGGAAEAPAEAGLDPDRLRPDLANVQRLHALTLDGARSERVARRHATGHRTARENIGDLCDPGTFVEYGPLVIGQGLKGTIEERLQYAPGDGFVMGLGRINGDLFEPRQARCLVASYDYTSMAGTQSFMNHRKTDRIFQTAEKLRAPLVLFAEGGGGRAGSPASSSRTGTDGEISGGGGFGIPSWAILGRLSGLVPTVGITSGHCFAGNAALVGCCDVVIATAGSNIGMGGPAVIEGGGLGVFRPDEIGPLSVQVPNGVVDIAVEGEAEAVAAAKKYLSYFQGRLPTWECADQRLLRQAIPENRLRVYDVRSVIELLADTDSVLELRRGFGLAMITSLVRIEGRPVGVIANNPIHLSGAIDSDAADKAARFMQLCDAYDIPILFLCDTPGIMVALTIILRKAYGLGAHTMGGGNHKMPVFTVSWPTGEFGGMGLEGAVKLGRRRELEAVADPVERRALYEQLVAQAYDRGKALNAAHAFEVEDVIDPAASRDWLTAGLGASPPPLPRDGKKRSCVDVW